MCFFLEFQSIQFQFRQNCSTKKTSTINFNPDLYFHVFHIAYARVARSLVSLAHTPPASPNMKRTSDLTRTPKRLHLSLSPNTPSASGSCYVEIGSTKVLCSVYGPREASSSSSGVFGSSINSSEFSTGSADTPFSSSSSSSPTPRTTLPKTSDAVDDAVISQQLSSSEEDAHGILEVTVQFAPFAKRVRSGIGGTIGGAGVVAQIGASNTLGGGGKGVSSRGGNVFDASSSSIIEEERRMSRFLERALSPSVLLSRIPKCIVEVHVWVLEAGGGETEAAVIGTSMALVDAGVEVIDLCVGATVMGVKRKRKEGGTEKEEEKVRFLVAPISKNPEQLLDDIGMDEEERGRRGGGGEEEDNVEVEVLRTSICMMMKRGLLTHTLHEGAAEGDEIIEALTVAMDACASSYQVMRETLLKRAAEVSSSSSSSS